MGKTGDQENLGEQPDNYIIYTNNYNNNLLDIWKRNKPDLAGHFRDRIHSLGNDAGLLF